MRLSSAAALFVSIGVFAGVSWAGAWTQPREHAQIISAVTFSHASAAFDRNGNSSIKTSFDKRFTQTNCEYGLTPAVTLFASLEYVSVKTQSQADIERVHNSALEGGARILLLTRIGMLSLQGSYKSAGAYNQSISDGRTSGRQIELRLLYGKSFKLFGADGFADIEAAKRWNNKPRPNEIAFDATAGLWLSQNNMAMVQSFNAVSDGAGEAPYKSYRLSKIELSYVRKITPRYSIQIGAFKSFAGHNIVAERGMVVSIWHEL